MKIAFGSFLLLLASLSAVSAGLKVTSLGKDYTPDNARVVASQTTSADRGSTSVRSADEENLNWKEIGYFQHSRDMGQVFMAPRDFRLDAIVLRVGPSNSAVLSGAIGAKVIIQFFEVSGTPHINDNGTPPGTHAKHGFSKNHRCDDFIQGVEYRSIRVVKGGEFPHIPVTRDAEGKPVPDGGGRMYFLRWDLTGEDELEFRAGKHYAFLVGFEEPGAERGFGLANYNSAHKVDSPSLTDRHDRYTDGWSLRREGDSTVPPSMVPGEEPPTERAVKEKLIREAVFAAGESRYALSPTSDGYPDVDTYRDLEFYIEALAGPQASSPDAQ